MNNIQAKAQKIDDILGRLVNRTVSVGTALFMGTVSYFVFTSPDFSLFSFGGILSVGIAGLFAWFVVYMWRRDRSLLQIMADQE